MFTRTDYFTDSLDAIRGGSAGTTSTNSPAAIVNFLSKTGRVPGGAIGYSLGLDHKQNRIDFNYGGGLGQGLHFQIGGFNRVGESTRNTNINVENGGQLRASLTKTFDGGYIRATFKSLDDKTPTFLPVPVGLQGNRMLFALAEVVIGWLLIRHAAVSLEKKKTAVGPDVAFYEGKIASAKFFAHEVLPRVVSEMQFVPKSDLLIMELSEDAF
jgi:hypothetical protein